MGDVAPRPRRSTPAPPWEQASWLNGFCWAGTAAGNREWLSEGAVVARVVASYSAPKTGQPFVAVLPLPIAFERPRQFVPHAWVVHAGREQVVHAWCRWCMQDVSDFNQASRPQYRAW